MDLARDGLAAHRLARRANALAGLRKSDLDLVAASLNDRPRNTLDYATPNEAFDALLANLAGGSETTNSRIHYQT